MVEKYLIPKYFFAGLSPAKSEMSLFHMYCMHLGKTKQFYFSKRLSRRQKRYTEFNGLISASLSVNLSIKDLDLNLHQMLLHIIVIPYFSFISNDGPYILLFPSHLIRVHTLIVLIVTELIIMNINICYLQAGRSG
jgi:hypothetical protein